MARFKMEDERFLETDRAAERWEEQRDWDGSNLIGRTSGSQWLDVTLYRTRSGRYALVTRSRYQGTPDTAVWLTESEVAEFFAQNEIEPPEALAAAVEALIE
jgi:hypothetical protein